jgi:hypothetical protein
MLLDHAIPCDDSWGKNLRKDTNGFYNHLFCFLIETLAAHDANQVDDPRSHMQNIWDVRIFQNVLFYFPLGNEACKVLVNHEGVRDHDESQTPLKVVVVWKNCRWIPSVYALASFSG